MSWRADARAVGLDPADVTDASEGTEFHVPDHDEPEWKELLKGATIGDGSNCIGARCALRYIPGADWVHIGASVAVVHYTDGRLLRYLHNGIIPKAQDEGHYPPPGQHTLRVPYPQAQLGASRPTGPKKRKSTRRTPSWAAKLRA